LAVVLGPARRGRAIAGIAHVGIDAVIEQQPDHGDIPRIAASCNGAVRARALTSNPSSISNSTTE
jgi:hypothetical protein